MWPHGHFHHLVNNTVILSDNCTLSWTPDPLLFYSQEQMLPTERRTQGYWKKSSKLRQLAHPDFTRLVFIGVALPLLSLQVFVFVSTRVYVERETHLRA
jgi:hypothetical protein